MDADQLFHRYQDLQQYVEWTEADVDRVRQAGRLIQPHLSTLVDDFYTEIERHPQTRAVIGGGPPQIARLKGTLTAWLSELFAGPYDRDYVQRRWRVGGRHVEIGLDQVYANAAMSRLRRGMMHILETSWPGAVRDSLAVRQSLNTLLDLDLAIIEDAYQAEHTSRQQRSERLAAELLERQRSASEILRLNTDLQRRVRELQALLDVIPVGIAIAQDVECRHIQVNAALARILRLVPGSPPPLTASPERPPDYRITRGGKDVPASELPMQVAVASNAEVRDVDLDVLHPDGTVHNLYCSAAPVLDEQGRPRGSVGAFVDVTERKRSEERLVQSERLAAIGQMMTGLAHESGNALARSQSCLEMLTWAVEDRPEAIDLIRRIQNAQDHLQQLYDEVRGYAAPVRLQREEWDLSLVWRQTWDNLAPARQGRDAELIEETDGLNLEMPIDPFRLGQVFRNVLENSLAACTGPMRVTIRCREVLLEGRPAVCVSVQDNGPGLTPEARQRIFEPFYTTKTRGTGLGMAIARQIVEAHGGRIAVGPGKPGAEIVITLPR